MQIAGRIIPYQSPAFCSAYVTSNVLKRLLKPITGDAMVDIKKSSYVNDGVLNVSLGRLT